MRETDLHLKQNKPYRFDARYHHKNGSTVWVICRGIALKDASGKFTSMIGTHADITSSKLAEEKLKEKASD